MPTKLDRQQGRVRAAMLVTGLLSAWGCASAPPPSPLPCSRVALEPAPPWTASAAWNVGEDELVLIDPGDRGLAGYGRDGRRRRQVSLELAELDFGEPMRFERVADGYVLVSKTQILHLDDDLSLRSRQQPFALLEASGLIDGSLNDAVLHDGVLHGYADFIDAGVKLGDDPDTAGTWRRGFVRLDSADGELKMLHELPIGNDGGDGEYASYYLYDRRPYVARLGDRIYILRFIDPWTVYRMTRRGLRQVASGDARDEHRAHALQAWNGKLYVLTSRTEPAPAEAATGEKTAPAATTDPRARLELLQAQAVVAHGHRQWTLHEIEPRDGVGRHLTLPTSAERLRLIPGRSFWTAIEETTSPNLGGESDRTMFLYLPATEIVAGSFSCAGDQPAESGTVHTTL